MNKIGDILAYRIEQFAMLHVRTKQQERILNEYMNVARIILNN